MIYKLLGIATLGVVMLAQPGPGLAGIPPVPPTDALKTVLSLTDAQITSLTQLQVQKRQQLDPLMTQIEEKQKAIHDALQKDVPDVNAIAALLVQVAGLQKQARTAASVYVTQATALLTTDQKTKIKDLEKAQSLQDAVHQAEMLDLLARPEGARGLGPARAGAGGPGMMRGPARMGFGGPGAPGPRE